MVYPVVIPLPLKGIGSNPIHHKEFNFLLGAVKVPYESKETGLTACWHCWSILCCKQRSCLQGGCITKLEQFLADHLLIMGAVGIGVSCLQVSPMDPSYGGPSFQSISCNVEEGCSSSCSFETRWSETITGIYCQASADRYQGKKVFKSEIRVCCNMGFSQVLT